MNPDLTDLLAELSDHDAEFLVVGAHALAAYGLVRATKDLDLWVRADASNAEKVYAALASFGAPLQELSVADLAKPGVVFQMGIDPFRVDILTSIDGVAFDDAWPNRLTAIIGGRTVPVLSRKDLLTNKRAVGRDQDLVDVKWLEQNPPTP